MRKPRDIAQFRELLALALGPSPRSMHFAWMEGAIRAMQVLIGDHWPHNAIADARQGSSATLTEKPISRAPRSSLSPHVAWYVRFERCVSSSATRHQKMRRRPRHKGRPKRLGPRIADSAQASIGVSASPAVATLRLRATIVRPESHL